MDDSEQSSTVVEDGIGDVSVKKRPRKQFLYSQILKQMEFYFSDANLSRDRFISQYLQKSEGVPIEVFLRCNKIRELTCDPNDIVKALRSSQLILVSEDGNSLSRKTEVKQKENQDDCIIYVEQLPPDANHDWVIGIFSAYGKVDYVSIPKFRNKPVNKGFAFVEFDTPEAAKRALEAFGSVGSCLPHQIPPEELCSIATFEEGNEQGQGADESQAQDEETEKTIKKAKKSEHDSLQDESGTLQESDDDSEPKSKKAKLDESSEVREKRKSKGGEKCTISKGSSENVVEEEEEDEKEKEEKNSSAYKKARKRRIMSEVTDAEEKNENGEMYADNESQNKKKKKHSFVEETENVYREILNEESKQDDASGKNKEKSEDGEDVNENVEGMRLDDNQEVCDAQLSKERKRKSVEKDSDTEDVDDDEGTAQKGKTDDNEEEAANDAREETDEPVGEASAKKKRSKRRNKDKKKNKKGEDPTYGLRIISKNEWRRLRNKYLTLQWEKMKNLKKHLARRRYGSVQQSPFSSQVGNRQNVRVDPQNPKTGSQGKPPTVFTPGVIIKISLSSPLMDVNSFKTSTRHCDDVQYVDAKEGDTNVFLRCSSSDGVQKLLLERKWENMSVLEGEDEKKYWEKIFEDREDKFKNPKKVRGKDKLMKRAERELGKHIRFDD